MPHLERLVPDEENQIGVLYIHTFNDYFWNAEMAQEFSMKLRKFPTVIIIIMNIVFKFRSYKSRIHISGYMDPDYN